MLNLWSDHYFSLPLTVGSRIDVCPTRWKAERHDEAHKGARIGVIGDDFTGASDIADIARELGGNLLYAAKAGDSGKPFSGYNASTATGISAML